MTRPDAVKILRRLLGPSLYWREWRDGARSQEEWDARRAALDEARQAVWAADEARDHRRAELLKNDQDYQRLTSTARAARTHSETCNARLRYRIECGTKTDIGIGMMLSSVTYAFNWQDAVNRAKARAASKER
jgi:hypothetical protein